MDNLLKEAIADAKAVRETALANAKLALEEAFTPHLKSMLSKKLQAEDEEADEVEPNGDAALESENPFADDDEEVSEGNETNSSDIAKSDNKEPSGDSSDTSGIGQEGDSEGSAAASGDEDENSEKAPDQAMGENSEPPMGDDEEVVKAPAQPLILLSRMSLMLIWKKFQKAKAKMMISISMKSLRHFLKKMMRMN